MRACNWLQMHNRISMRLFGGRSFFGHRKLIVNGLAKGIGILLFIIIWLSIVGTGAVFRLSKILMVTGATIVSTFKMLV